MIFYFNLAKIYAPVIFDFGQFATVNSSWNVFHLINGKSLCQKFCEFFSARLLKYYYLNMKQLTMLSLLKSGISWTLFKYNVLLTSGYRNSTNNINKVNSINRSSHAVVFLGKGVKYAANLQENTHADVWFQ